MKSKFILSCICFIICANIGYAQSNNFFPTQQRVDDLLNQIDNCKDAIDEAGQEITIMENNPNDYTLADYNNAKDLIERAKTCLSAARKDLRQLKKDHPEWFNKPSIEMPIRHPPGAISLKDINKRVQDVMDDVAKKIDRILQLPIPE